MLILLLQTKFTNQTLVGAKITALPPQVFSERELVRYMLSPVRLSVVCNVRAPYSDKVQMFGNISTALGTLATH